MLSYIKNLLFLLIPVISFAHGNHNHSIEDLGSISRVRIFTTPTKIGELKMNGMSIDHGTWRGDIYFECEVFEKDMSLLALTTTNYEVVYKNANDYYNARRAVFANKKAPVAECEEGVTDKYVIPKDFEIGSFAGFFTYDEMLGHLDNMATKYPNIISERAPIGDFKTHQNRDIFHLKMSDNPNADESSTEKQVLYTAVHHSREPVSMSQLIFTMYYLLENYEKDPIVKNIIDEHELYFVPCLNPDGYNLDQALTSITGNGTYNHAFWRKNARDNDESGNISGQDGVDLNRNYSFAWGLNNQGSSPDQTSPTYRGPSAASEPEVQAINWLCQQNDFLVALNCHTYGNLLIHPWAYIPFDSTPDSLIFRTLGKALTQDNNYVVGTGDEVLGYSVNGDSDDWMYGDESVNKILAFTPEVGSTADGFYPPAERIVPLCLDMILQNLNAVRCLESYVYPTVLEESLTVDAGLFYLEILQAGLEPTAVDVKLEYINCTPENGVSNYNFDLDFSQTVTLQTPFIPDAGLSGGDLVGVNVTVIYPNGLFETFDYLRPYPDNSSTGGLFTSYEDNADTFDNWNSNNWELTSLSFYSPPTCFTDSRNGVANQGTNTILLDPVIDLKDATTAELKFWTKWAIEPQYDYVQVNAVEVESQTRVPLCGKYTSVGNNYYLSPDEPYYDDFQNTWVEEIMDLSAFAGKQIQIEFLFFADNYIEEDGFYFDNLRILTDDESLVIGEETSDGGTEDGGTDDGGTDDGSTDDGSTDDGTPVGIAAIGDFVFADENENGLQDGNEMGIAGVSVLLFNASNTAIPLGVTSTDENGNYEFTNLETDKNYVIGFETPLNFNPTIMGEGVEAGSELDSDLNPSTGLTGTISLIDGEFNKSVDAGFIPPENINTSAYSLNDSTDELSLPKPNPANNTFSVTYNFGSSILKKMVITNIEGKIVKQISFEGEGINGEYSFDVSDLSCGLYFYYLLDGNVMSQTHKLVISR